MSATAKIAASEAEQKHTPGPWRATTENISGRRIFMPDDTVEIRGQDGRGLIACLYAQNWAGTQDAANARLIAAAPDLLAAVKLMRSHPLTPIAIEAADAAIARAEGR